MRLFRTAVAAVLLFAGQAFARPITFDDLYGMPRASDPQISPGGKTIAYTLNEQEPKEGRSVSHIWLMNSDGSAKRQLTNGPGGEDNPRWSPDGTFLAFSSRRDGAAQIFILPMDGGEAWPATAEESGAQGMVWRPDGEAFLYTSRVRPDATKASDSIEARAYSDLLYRHYNTWDDGTVSQLFEKSFETAETRNVLPSEYDIPSSLLGGSGGYTYSPDGKEICLVKNTSREPAVWVNNDLFSVSKGKVERLTDNPALDLSPAYSPDARFLCYRGTARVGYESDQKDLLLLEIEKEKHRNLTTGFDRSINDFLWSPDGRFIYFTAIDHGLSKVYRLNLQGEKIEPLLEDAVYGDLACAPGGDYLVLSRSRAHEPAELYRYDLDSRKLSRLTFVTDRITRDLDLSPAEPFSFKGTNGDLVHGFLTRPPEFDATKRYPLVLLIHGGPQWCWLGDFNYYGWNTQLTAAKGYVVAQIDPHGSVGYGIKFKEYVSGNWGKGDFDDLMSGLDYLIKKHSFIDSERLAALGRSYGGFMANWIAGHTNRFKCLVSIDGTYDHGAKYGSTEELWFPEWEFRGTPWTNPEEFKRSSPATYASRFKTPMQIIHGQKDYRVDLSQGLMLFTALRRQGIPAELLYFPDEGHSIRKIKNHRYVYGKQFEWLDRWLTE